MRRMPAHESPQTHRKPRLFSGMQPTDDSLHLGNYLGALVNWVEMPTDLGRFDVVLASDVLYEHRYASLVADAISRTLVRGGEAIVADPGRIALDEFLEECSDRGLASEGDVRQYVDGVIKQTITLWRLRWRA